MKHTPKSKAVDIKRAKLFPGPRPDYGLTFAQSIHYVHDLTMETRATIMSGGMSLRLAEDVWKSHGGSPEEWSRLKSQALSGDFVWGLSGRTVVERIVKSIAKSKSTKK